VARLEPSKLRQYRCAWMCEGDLPGAPRTGNDLKMTSITIHRIENGKLVEKWGEKDMI
jgi:predicted ester cyclase